MIGKFLFPLFMHNSQVTKLKRIIKFPQMIFKFCYLRAKKNKGTNINDTAMWP